MLYEVITYPGRRDGGPGAGRDRSARPGGALIMVISYGHWPQVILKEKMLKLFTDI